MVVFPGPVEVVRGVAGETELHYGVLEFLCGDFFFWKMVLAADLIE